MKSVLAIVLVLSVAFTACGGQDEPEISPASDADRLDAISQRIAVIETAVAAQSPPTTQTAVPIATPRPTPEPTSPPPTPTPPPDTGQDICFRALPVQRALIDQFSGPDLCSAITIGELFRLEELEVGAKGYPLRKADFANMPNLRTLELAADVDGLTPDVFHELSGLRQLQLYVYLDADQQLPAEALVGLPSGLETLRFTVLTSSDEEYRGRLVDLPADLFAAASGIEHLTVHLRSDYGRCLRFDSKMLAGLSRLETLSVGGGNGVWPMPRELFADLESLETLELDGPSCRREDDRFERNYEEDGRHRLYFPSVETLLEVADYCNDYGYCEAVGLIEQ